MNITLDQNPEQLTALLTVHLTESDYAPEVDKQIKEYTKRAQIKGFRPGKVPPALVRKMYGKGILGEEINKMLGKAVDGYVKEQKLRLLGEPLPVPSNVDFETDKDFDFAFELGLLPDFELPAEGSVEIERHQVELDEATLAETNEQIGRQFGESTNPESSEHGDYLYGKLKKHDEEGEGKTVLLPTHKVTNEPEKFLSVKAGDAVVFDLAHAFAGDASAIANFSGLSKDEAAQASGDYVLHVEKINRTAAPEFNQDLFDKVFGPETVSSREEFDAKVREVVSENYLREAEGLATRQLIDKLVEQTPIELPKDFFKKFLLRANEGKLTAEQIEEHYDDYARELKWSMIRNKVVEEQGLKVGNEEIEDRALDQLMSQFGGMAAGAGDMREAMRSYVTKQLRENNGKQYVDTYEAILAEKVVENLRGKVVVKDVPVTAEEFRQQAASKS
ncbi:trigger factor [uncultured Hymenobacter sp.]|uniref:trigger factor n=1 Tax=uncultured Hymenobacter sp. TaxID=170016 RepID=UPI0035C961B4